MSVIPKIRILSSSDEDIQICRALHQKLTVDSKYRRASMKISSCRCNSYLDLKGEIVSPQLWNEMQEMIINKLLSFPVKYIDIRESSIKIDDVDPRIHHMIVKD